MLGAEVDDKVLRCDRRPHYQLLNQNGDEVVEIHVFVTVPEVF